MDFSSAGKALGCLSRRLGEDQAPQAMKEACAYFQSSKMVQGGDMSQDEMMEYERQAMVLLSSDRWDCLAMGLQVASLLLARDQVTISADFETSLIQSVEAHLEHSEPRVRSFVAQVRRRG